MAKTVTYRDLPHDIDPLDFLFNETRLTVPESRFTPELVVQFYERMIGLIDMNALHAKSDHNPWGLQSLPSMLQYKPKQYGQQWLRLEADKEHIEKALPENTPYQLLYLPLFPLHLPDWQAVPVKYMQGQFKNEQHLDTISARALLIGKNGKLYYLHVQWEPTEQYYAFSQKPKLSEGPYTFKLYNLYLQPWSWDEPQLLSQLTVQGWTDLNAARTRVQCALNGTADILDSRVKKMLATAELLEQMSIYFGR